jgi:hypothetical protein
MFKDDTRLDPVSRPAAVTARPAEYPAVDPVETGNHAINFQIFNIIPKETQRRRRRIAQLWAEEEEDQNTVLLTPAAAASK